MLRCIFFNSFSRFDATQDGTEWRDTSKRPHLEIDVELLPNKWKYFKRSSRKNAHGTTMEKSMQVLRRRRSSGPFSMRFAQTLPVPETSVRESRFACANPRDQRGPGNVHWEWRKKLCYISPPYVLGPCYGVNRSFPSVSSGVAGSKNSDKCWEFVILTKWEWAEETSGQWSAISNFALEAATASWPTSAETSSSN